MPKLTCTAADVKDQSISFFEKLLEVKLTRLPEDAEQLQTLLESGTVPVTQVGSWSSFCYCVGFAESLSMQSGCLGKDCFTVYRIRLFTANLQFR